MKNSCLKLEVKTNQLNKLSHIKNSFIAQDDVELGYENKIPLWLFGFLY